VLVHIILDTTRHSWPPFVLVVGLLLIGLAAARDGLFEAVGARIAGTRLGSRGLLIALLGLVAIVTAVLNLDTAVVFMTPVLVHAARRRGLDERPFLYGSVFMANAASILLPGSNLTNLLVLSRDPMGGVGFAISMAPAWLVACALTAAFLTVAYPLGKGETAHGTAPRLRLGVGAVAALAATVAVLATPNAALPVLAVGLAATALQRRRPRLDVRVLAFLFGLTVVLGTLAREWGLPSRVLEASGRWPTAAIAAASSIAVNNLPAAVLLSAHAPVHPRALLLGLDLGPNLAVTGSLSAVLWLQAARSVKAEASIVTYSRLGLLLVPLTLAGAIAALWL
jgi:arsenical pump membrane protein